MSLGILQQKPRTAPPPPRRPVPPPHGYMPPMHGYGGLGATGGNCWDLMSPCDPNRAGSYHSQMLAMQSAIAQARQSGDPAAQNFILNMQQQLNALNADCAARAKACTDLQASIKAKMAQYGCSASSGPFATMLQQQVNGNLSKADQVPETGVFDAATCAAFWKAFNRAPTMQDIIDGMDDSTRILFAQQKQCGAPNAFKVTIPSCPRPPSTDVHVTAPPQKPPGGGPRPPPIVSPVPPYTPPPPKKMSMAAVGGIIAAVAVVGYAIAKKKGLIG